MRESILAAAVLLAFSAAALPAKAQNQTLSFADARHLLARTGFMPRPAELAPFEGMSRAQAVARIIDGARPVARTAPPAWADDRFLSRAPGRMASEEERRAARMAARDKIAETVAWWYREMASTDSPFTERMTLFWHNHFTTSFTKVREARLLYRQNVTLRRHALGNFRQFVHAMAADPAMVVYLDGARSRRGEPNENFARELLELFTLGEGRYSERDIKEAARAFTGWTIDRETGAFVFNRAMHDDGGKTFFGRTGAFNGTDIIDIVFTKPEVATYIAGKAWREFVSDVPDDAEIARIANRFRASGYEIKVLMRELLLSPHFWAAENRGRLVRSPAELMAGSLRFFNLEVPPPAALISVGRALGQQVFNPPNVKGWPGGTQWITANTLLAREQVLRRLIGANGKAEPAGESANGDVTRDMAPGNDTAERAPIKGPAQRLDHGPRGAAFAAWYAGLPARFKAPNELVALLLPTPPTQPVGPAAASADLARRLVLDPAFQLK